MGSDVTSLRRLNAEDFKREVLAANPAVAVFDCDGTLWSGDAGYGFMVWSIEVGMVSRNASDWIDSRYRLYRAGEVSEEQMCGEMVQLYDGLREGELRRAAAEYFRRHVEASIFPEMHELIKRLRTLGTELWAVSSTNNWVIEEGVERFGIPPSRVLAARVRVEEALISSALVDVPTGQGKATALVRNGVPHPDVVFGNSIHDAAILRMAKHAFPVNPTAALLDLAAEQDWPVFYPAAALKDTKS